MNKWKGDKKRVNNLMQTTIKVKWIVSSVDQKFKNTLSKGPSLN